MKVKKNLLIMVALIVVAVSAYSVYAYYSNNVAGPQNPSPNGEDNSNYFMASCGEEGKMKCDDTVGCKHRTCKADGHWGDWVSFGSNYKCTENTAGGGGQRCSYNAGSPVQ